MVKITVIQRSIFEKNWKFLPWHNSLKIFSFQKLDFYGEPYSTRIFQLSKDVKTTFEKSLSLNQGIDICRIKTIMEHSFCKISHTIWCKSMPAMSCKNLQFWDSKICNIFKLLHENNIFMKPKLINYLSDWSILWPQ